MIIYLYAAFICFIVFSAYQAWRYAKMPLHGRMELYPVPKEKGFEHGGSYFEQVSWWEHPQETSSGTELKEMLKEMLFIKKLFDNQKPFWWLSYALHLGLYFLIGWTILLVLEGIAILNGAAAGSETTGLMALLNYLTSAFGFWGFALTTIGALVLFLRRKADNVLHKYTTPQEYFNLLLLFAVGGSGILAWGLGQVEGPQQLMAGLLTFTAPVLSASQMIHLILLGFALIYIPLSKMSHYVGKYFSFHKVLWENHPNLAGSEIERRIREQAASPASHTWSAPHIMSGVNRNAKQ